MFGGSVPVTGTCVDQQAALFAEHCHTAGEAKCTYGTGAFMLACTGDKPTRSSNGLVGCPAWRIGDDLTYCLDGQVYTVGAAVTWLIEMGIMSEPADLDRLGRDGRRIRRRHVRAGARRAGRAVLEAARQGGVHRDDHRAPNGATWCAPRSRESPPRSRCSPRPPVATWARR